MRITLIARYDFHIEPGSMLAELVPEPRLTAVYARESQLGVLAYVLEKGLDTLEGTLSADQAEQLRKSLPASFFQLDESKRAETASTINALVRDAHSLGGRAMGLAIFPPDASEKANTPWLTVSDITDHMAYAGASDTLLANSSTSRNSRASATIRPRFSSNFANCTTAWWRAPLRAANTARFRSR